MCNDIERSEITVLIDTEASAKVMCNDIEGAAEDNSIDIERSEITVLIDIEA